MLAANLGVLWVAVEATTIVTAFLVGQRRTRAAVEAAWKYVVICSAGIAIALLGTSCSTTPPGTPAPATGLDWAALTATRRTAWTPAVTRIAVVLLILGFGTKAGPRPAARLAARRAQPSPRAGVRADVRGAARGRVLRHPARQGHRRRRRSAPASPAPCWPDRARLPRWWPRPLLIAQRDYKRMLAYSSIEHMGLLALGAAIGGPLAIAAVLLHMLGHGLAKSDAVPQRRAHPAGHGTSQIADGPRAWPPAHRCSPAASAVGVLALLGFPPVQRCSPASSASPAPVSPRGLGWVTAAVFVLVAGRLRRHPGGHTSRMLLGAAARRRLHRRPADPRTGRGHRDPHH